MAEPTRILRLVRTVWSGCTDVFAGAMGSRAYDAYVAHCRERHPDRPLPTREEFFRRDLSERWDGVRRCC